MKSFRLTSPVTLQAGRVPTFRGLAYDGGTMVIAGWQHPVVIVLASLQKAVLPLPLLREHDAARPVGHVDRLEVNGAGITIGGGISGVTEDAAIVCGMAKQGYGWQLSVGGNPGWSELIPKGKTVEANGKTFAGPVFLAHECELREISIVSIGAARETSITIAARAVKGASPMGTFEEWLATLGMDPANLSDEVKTALQTAYDAMKKGSEPPTETNSPANAAAETARIQAINAACQRQDVAGMTALQATAIATGLTPEVVNTRVTELIRAHQLAALITSRGTGPMHLNSQGVGRPHLAAALMVRAGFGKAAEKEYGATVMDQSKRFHSASLVDLCAASLRLDGKEPDSNRQLMIRAALSGGTFTNIMSDSAHKILFAAYAENEPAWRAFCAVKSAANFKAHTGIRPSFIGDLALRPKGASIDHASVGENTFSWRVHTFARQLQIDYEDFEDDDLNAFSETLPSFGRAAARTIGNLVAATILGNAGSFFSTGNANYFEGGTSNLQASSLATAVQMLREMTDANGVILDLAPAVLAVPADLEMTARELLQSAELQRYVASGTDRQPMGNSFQNFATLAVEPRLGTGCTDPISQVAQTGSATGWYLFSQPQNAAVIVGFLNGQESPQLETFGLNADIDHLSYGFRVHHRFGCSLGDPKAVIKSKGAA